MSKRMTLFDFLDRSIFIHVLRTQHYVWELRSHTVFPPSHSNNLAAPYFLSLHQRSLKTGTFRYLVNCAIQITKRHFLPQPFNAFYLGPLPVLSPVTYCMVASINGVMVRPYVSCVNILELWKVGMKAFLDVFRNELVKPKMKGFVEIMGFRKELSLGRLATKCTGLFAGFQFLIASQEMSNVAVYLAPPL